jgi:pyruvate carboxylase subunit B
MHGETYHIKVTGSGHKGKEVRPFYLSIDGVPEEILVETLDEIMPDESAGKAGAVKGSKRPKATEPGHVTTSMPGSIVDVLVAEGDAVSAGDAVLITEAMKMETEIQAPISGTIRAIHVSKGDSVNPDEVLVEIE